MTLSNNRKDIIGVILKLSDNHYLSDSKSFCSHKDKKLFWKSISEIKSFIKNCIKTSNDFFVDEEEVQGCNKILECIDVLINKVGEKKDSSEYSCSIECRDLSEESSKVLEKISLKIKGNLEFEEFIKQEKTLNREEKGDVDWPGRRFWLMCTLLSLADKDFQERDWLGDGCFHNDLTYFGSDELENFNFYDCSLEKQCEYYLGVIYKTKKEIKLIFEAAEILDKLQDYVDDYSSKGASKNNDSLLWNSPLLQK